MQKSFTKNQDGGDVDENAVLHSENAFCVGLLGAIHKKMNYILKTFPRCARGLYHLIENGGGRFGEKCRFSNKKTEFGLYRLIILTKLTILKRATNACLQNCAWRRI